jgi:hypothetical protein
VSSLFLLSATKLTIHFATSREVNGDGTFQLTNLPPGRYWALAQQPQAETPTSTEKLRLPMRLKLAQIFDVLPKLQKSKLN